MLIEMLAPEEARVLGTLLEKSLATPDYYPMTLNALRTACNQKTSREPVTDYDDATVAAALAGLKRKALVAFTPYGSQPNQFKYRHFLEDARFNLRKPGLAVLAVLLLRGAQTLNDIKVRASSLHPFDSLEAAEEALRDLAARPEPLVELLPKRPGWKEPRWRDLVREHAADAGPGPASGSDAGSLLPEAFGGTAPGPRMAPADASGDGMRDEVESLRREVAELREAVAALKGTVDRMRADLY
jgi:hypothetical protein